ncbi:sphinganine C4-monooxygenase, partial [Phenoliferia sp. Uapishka_3]
MANANACVSAFVSTSLASPYCLSNTSSHPVSYPLYHIPRPSLLSLLSDRHLSIAAPFLVYWTLSIIFHLIDISHIPYFERHRIHDLEETRTKNRRVGVGEVVLTVLFQQVLQTALGLVWLVDDEVESGPMRDHAADIARWSLVVRKGVRRIVGGQEWMSSVGGEVVGEGVAEWVYWWGVPACQLFLALVVLDAWQYFWHRVVHESNYLYRKIHSWHHLLFAPYAFGALYNHPLEGFLLDTFGAALAHSIAGMTTRQGIVFFALSTAKTVDDHCGFMLPWDPFQILFGNSADYHDIHHQLGGFKKNYEQPWFRYLDYFCGTQISREEFEQFKAERKKRALVRAEKEKAEAEESDPNLVA